MQNIGPVEGYYVETTDRVGESRNSKVRYSGGGMNLSTEY